MVLVVSNFLIPSRTAYRNIGTVIVIGYVRSKQDIEWFLFGNIIVAVPIANGISQMC